MINLPADARALIDELNANGHKAYLVGGSVRDALMGRQPKDWDICTSATPEEMREVFSRDRVIETGLKHGTLTVLRSGVPYEITTFRTDGAYTDHRHPDGVVFVKDVREDLARRDFTVNAMAWHPEEGLIDAFHGREDLERGVIRCVGDPEERFNEDALRILRALRFASACEFEIAKSTADAARELKPTLALVAAERIRIEISKTLTGPGAGAVLRGYGDILTAVLPEIGSMFGFEQCNPHHLFDLWEHTVRAVESVPRSEALRLAALLHDVGKPLVFTRDADGVGHFFGHAERSAEIAERICERLRLDNATHERVVRIVACHHMDIGSTERILRRRIAREGGELLRDLAEMRRADAIATGRCPEADADAARDEYLKRLDGMLASDLCFSLKDLAVNGRDLMEIGLAGPAVGRCLNELLDRVVDGALTNEREALIGAAKARAAAEAKE